VAVSRRRVPIPKNLKKSFKTLHSGAATCWLSYHPLWKSSAARPRHCCRIGRRRTGTVPPFRGRYGCGLCSRLGPTNAPGTDNAVPHVYRGRRPALVAVGDATQPDGTGCAFRVRTPAPSSPATMRPSSTDAPQRAGAARRKVAMRTPVPPTFHAGTPAANDATRDAHAHR